MKAILKFNLPEDKDEYQLATSAGKMYGVIWDLDQFLRSIEKYGAPGIDHVSAIAIREHLNLLLSEQSISL